MPSAIRRRGAASSATRVAAPAAAFAPAYRPPWRAYAAVQPWRSLDPTP